VGWRGAANAVAFRWRAAMAGWRRPQGKSGDAWRGTRRGAWLPSAGDSLGGARWWHACPHSGGRRRVADERDPTGSGRVPGREVRGARGLTGEENGVGRARRKREVGQVQMNSDDF
jgi:hypothetical protein